MGTGVDRIEDSVDIFGNDEVYENDEFSKFETALSVVSNSLDYLIPTLQAKMAEVKIADEDCDEVHAWMIMVDMGRLCEKFCIDAAREIKDLTCVYFEVVLGLIEAKLCMAGIDSPKDSSWAGVIGEAIDDLRAQEK